MAKTRPGRKDVDSYTIRGTSKIVRGNTRLPFCVFLLNTVHFPVFLAAHEVVLWLAAVVNRMFGFCSWRLCSDAALGHVEAALRGARGEDRAGQQEQREGACEVVVVVLDIGSHIRVGSRPVGSQ